jgi:hypothetical protein
MPFAHGLLLLRARPCRYTASSAVITYTIVNNGVPVNYRTVDIRIVDYSSINVHYSGIITETVSTPATAGKAHAKVAVAIVYAAIKPNMRPPVPLVK